MAEVADFIRACCLVSVKVERGIKFPYNQSFFQDVIQHMYWVSVLRLRNSPSVEAPNY